MLFVWSKAVPSDEETLWEERLALMEGLVITQQPGRKTLRVEVYHHDKLALETLQTAHGGTVAALPDQNWVAMSVPEPILVKVRDRFIVTSQRDSPALEQLQTQYPKRTIISIPAELAFGTGDHATTATCLRLLVDHSRKARKPWRALDLGTGTGVLAIAAKMLGAETVEGCDFDPLALEVAKRNVVENGYDDKAIPMTLRDVLKWTPEPAQWDLIMANLFCDVLQAIFGKLRVSLASEGRVMVSGILASQGEETLTSARHAGFEIEKVLQRGKWVTALLRES